MIEASENPEFLNDFLAYSSTILNKSQNTIKEYNLNMIILQVRPFSDAIYESEIYPSSKTIVNKEGDKLPLDILEYFIDKSHQLNIEVHAWINPYRIRTNTDISSITYSMPFICL